MSASKTFHRMEESHNVADSTQLTAPFYNYGLGCVFAFRSANATEMIQIIFPHNFLFCYLFLSTWRALIVYNRPHVHFDFYLLLFFYDVSSIWWNEGTMKWPTITDMPNNNNWHGAQSFLHTFQMAVWINKTVR